MARRELDDISMYIWKANERVAHALRNMVMQEMATTNGSDFSESLSSRQNHMVIAVRSLCEDYPGGVSLKQLAKHLNVTPSSASVMVESLTSSGYLVRDTSTEDRRSVRIRLSKEAESFYDAADRVIQAKLCALADELGEQVLHQWSALLHQVERVLVVSEDDPD